MVCSKGDALDVGRLVQSLTPNAFDLLACVDLYLSGRKIDEKPVRLAVGAFIEVSGNRDVQTYERADARLLVASLLAKGNKTATVRLPTSSFRNFSALQDVPKTEPFLPPAITTFSEPDRFMA